MRFTENLKKSSRIGFAVSTLLFLQAFFYSKETFNVQIWNERFAMLWIAICFLILLSKLMGFRYTLAASLAAVLALPVLINALFRVGGDIAAAWVLQSPDILVMANLFLSCCAALLAGIIIGDLVWGKS